MGFESPLFLPPTQSSSLEQAKFPCPFQGTGYKRRCKGFWTSSGRVQLASLGMGSRATKVPGGPCQVPSAVLGPWTGRVQRPALTPGEFAGDEDGETRPGPTGEHAGEMKGQGAWSGEMLLLATLDATRRLQPVSWAGWVEGFIPRGGGVGISHQGSTERR